MTIEEMNRAMLVYTAMHELQRALLLGGSALREREKELVEAVSVWLDGRRREDAAQETPDRKEGESMTQKEKYKRAASAMRNALASIVSDGPSTEYLLRAAKDEIRAALPYEDSDYWRADAPAEGIAVEAEKLETEDEPNEGEGEAKKLTRAAVLEKARACVCGEREEDYGSPEDSFGCIAELWEAYLRAACVSPNSIITVTPTDVAMMMALLKIARVGTSFVGGTADSFVDLAGYAACGAECAEVKMEASSDDA